MRVIYDISVLGVGHYHQRARTGVFRVVEHVAQELIHSQDVELTFCASSSFHDLSAALDYLQDHLSLQSVPFPHSKLKRLFDIKLHHLNRQIGVVPQYKRLLLKLARRILFHANQVVEPYADLINLSSLEQADIFHSPFFPLSAQLSSLKSIKKFITVYDLIPILFPQFFEFDEDHLIKQVLKSLDPDSWAICISQSTKEDLCNYLDFNPSRIFVAHLAASKLFYPCSALDKIATTKKKYNIPDAPYILSLSTLEPRKNIDHTIRCFAKLVQQENIQDLNLVLVGTKGWDFNKIFEELSNYSLLHDRILLTGYVADEDLASLYSGAMMFVYPSFYEGFGLPPLEAMQCGVPVITSNTSSLPEVVGDAGIMVDPTDGDALCQNMLELYNDVCLRESMSQKSIERSRLFSWDKCAQETISAYKIALDS